MHIAFNHQTTPNPSPALHQITRNTRSTFASNRNHGPNPNPPARILAECSAANICVMWCSRSCDACRKCLQLCNCVCVFVGDIGADHNTSQCVRSSQCPMFGMRTIISAIVIVENPLCLLSRRSHSSCTQAGVQSALHLATCGMWPVFSPTNKNDEN